MSEDFETGRIIEGECTEVMSELPESSIHAVVTDPPYNFDGGFMGKEWDNVGGPKQYQKWCESWARECLRVIKPGGHLLAFSGNRTHHRAFSGIEDAGFEIRDTITWHYSEGFPKALDVSKAIDKAADAEREVVATREANDFRGNAKSGTGGIGTKKSREAGRMEYEYTAPATDAAERWDGFKTALKPATEYVVVARAPLSEGTVAENVMEHGTGALNIGASRIETDESWGRREMPDADTGVALEGSKSGELNKQTSPSHDKGRYPANVVFDERAARELDRQSGVSESNIREPTGATQSADRTAMRAVNTPDDTRRGFDDEGGASRFFYTSKASKSERNIGLPDDEQNEHPTVKPVNLMRWLVQLVTAEGQVVVDPFAGSGTTLLAADYLGREWVGIEKDEEHAELARRRINNYDASEVKEWIDDESVTEARQETLDALTQADGGGSE